MLEYYTFITNIISSTTHMLGLVFCGLRVVLFLNRKEQTIISILKSGNGSRVSALGIATGYGLDDRGVGIQVPVGSGIFSSSVVQTGSGIHPASYPIGTGGSSPGGKVAGA
jgi:hypothetical protein